MRDFLEDRRWLPHDLETMELRPHLPSRLRRQMQRGLAWAAILLWGLLPLGTAEETPSREPKVSSSANVQETLRPASQDEDYAIFRELADTLDQIERNYVQTISRRELIEAAIEGMIRKLDPHSQYIARDEIRYFRQDMESQFGGIGVTIRIADGQDRGQLTVGSVLPGTPAAAAGVRAGDEIVRVGAESTREIRLPEAVEMLQGAPGTTVEISVVHSGEDEPVPVSITRDIVKLDTVLGVTRNAAGRWDYWLDRSAKIALVRVTSFGPDTAADLKRVLESLTTEGLRALILDMRFNPGGLLSAAIEVSDLFVEEGRIVSVEGRNVPESVWDAEFKGTYTNFPMAILVNGFSASGSEIVAACLQDHERAVVIGERTWGKGSVQHVVELDGGRSAVKITTASYHRPSGKNIHRFPDSTEGDDWGVQPNENLHVDLPRREMFQLHRELQQLQLPEGTNSPTSREGSADSGENSEPRDGAVGNESEPWRFPSGFEDRQLRRAWDYLQSEIAS